MGKQREIMNSPYAKLENEGQNTGQYNNQYGNYDKIQGVRNEVNEAKQVMAQNIERLDNLQNRSADLEQGASEFQSRARSLKRKYWWRNMKMWMILGITRNQEN